MRDLLNGLRCAKPIIDWSSLTAAQDFMTYIAKASLIKLIKDLGGGVTSIRYEVRTV